MTTEAKPTLERVRELRELWLDGCSGEMQMTAIEFVSLCDFYLEASAEARCATCDGTRRVELTSDGLDTIRCPDCLSTREAK